MYLFDKHRKSRICGLFLAHLKFIKMKTYLSRLVNSIGLIFSAVITKKIINRLEKHTFRLKKQTNIPHLQKKISIKKIDVIRKLKPYIPQKETRLENFAQKISVRCALKLRYTTSTAERVVNCEKIIFQNCPKYILQTLILKCNFILLITFIISKAKTIDIS